MKTTGIHKVIALATLGSLLVATNIHAQSADALVNKLVEKGILTQSEAANLRAEATNDVNRSATEKVGVAAWVKKAKFGGDFRGRYDGAFQDNANKGTGSAKEDRQQFRYRLRYGVTAELTDNFEAGFRLGSGQIGSAAPSLGGSPFSANTTEGNDGSRKFIFVDLAYGKWKPNEWFTAEIGKMNSAFWFTDMVLDPDYNPEGAQEKITLALNDCHKINLTAGQYVIAENFNSTSAASSANSDVYIFMAQADWQAKWSDHLSSRLAAGGYAFMNQSAVSTNLETFIGQNGTSAAGTGAPNFNPIVARAEVSYAFDCAPFFNGPFPITLGFEYANNPGADHLGTGNKGYNAGLTLGDAKKKGNWSVSYNYKHIGTAAVWHGLNDDDFGFNSKGGTDVAGHQLITSYHAAEPLWVNLRLMRTQELSQTATTSAHQTRVFFDVLLAF
jgi:hypothetical protein